MPHSFYNNREYRKSQGAITKKNWDSGVFDFMRRKEERICARDGCGKKFEVIHSDPKIYCSHNCAAMVNNAKRGPMSAGQKVKIGEALKGKKSPHEGKIFVSRVKIICANQKCKKVFLVERWMKRKYCSNKCAMAVTGGKPTSPKASRGKAGIRKDISDTIYFHSRLFYLVQFFDSKNNGYFLNNSLAYSYLSNLEHTRENK
ncbi:MAG: hypothetical protein A2401_02150 [Candidatus Staskawiczbacteria bacterium RIFOXYC1_FULL_38_18]|uniref:Uncharacterized protein n=1 Tax=Candidatus Staskawiczbacteria bacterium RIFOXYC1_FULL_38_18 TaxID=1802229 RepID=A0A1G2JGA8_9BACT|nr:MAG: hypothetical protein A2401_02150 [Candidatus Staskawiczbacteria bacterium RIFOXYC1_FULL_38_18]